MRVPLGDPVCSFLKHVSVLADTAGQGRSSFPPYPLCAGDGTGAGRVNQYIFVFGFGLHELAARCFGGTILRGEQTPLTY